MTAREIKQLINNDLQTPELQNIAEAILSGQRISDSDALVLYQKAELGYLGILANYVREQKNGRNVFFNRNFHIEPTNVCINNCKFCSYSRKQGQEGVWEMSESQIFDIVKHYKNSKATEVHIVGGVHPDKEIEYYGNLIKEIKKIIPGIVVKAFTAVELEYMINKAGLSISDGLKKLKADGLESIPGGGAEIFQESIREQICPEKTSSNTWLEIHKTAHQLGISTNATMLYGHIESYADRIDHMKRLRELQDVTHGFSAFIPLKYRKENNKMNTFGEVTLTEDLKNYAISRLYLDNIPHIKAYWVMSGLDTTKAALSFGADDIDGTVNDSTKIYTMAGVEGKAVLTVEQITDLIKSINMIPVERDTFYNVIKTY